MAARKTTSSTNTTQAAPDAVAVDGVGPDAEAATPAPTDVTPETAGADTREDARAAALAALAGGAQPAPPEGEDVRPEPPLDVEAHPEDQDVDAGGGEGVCGVGDVGAGGAGGGAADRPAVRARLRRQ